MPATKVPTAVAAVAVAEKTVADSTVVEVSSDDGRLICEVTVRVGNNGRELRIDGSDGPVLSNQSDRLDQLRNERD